MTIPTYFSRVLTAALICVALFPVSVSALSLQEVIAHTVKTNPDVQAARQEVKAREHEIRQAKAGYLPTFDAEAGIGREWTESPSTGGESITLTREEAALRLRQLVFDGGATSSEVARQKARYQSALYEAIEIQENTALDAAEAYINVLRQYELLGLLKESLDEHQSIFDQMSLRSEAGVGSRSDLDQISARLSLANSNYIAGQNNLLDAMSNFQIVVGYSPDVTTLVEPARLDLPSSLEGALVIALENHPTLKSANADIEAAEAQHRAAKSPYYPDIRLEGDRTWNEDIDGVRGDNEDWVIALRLRYNLYNGGADVARRKQTAELLTQSKDIRNSSRRQVEESMRLSWYAYESTNKQLSYLNTYVSSVTSTKSAYSKQFNIGRRTLLDLLNTENEVIEAKQNYANAKYDQLFAQSRVANAEGNLTQKLGIK